MFNFLLVFFGLIFLIVLHEFSHFLAAKKAGVLVEEFGIGYPPRIFAKKIKNTIYSLNLIFFGAFVKLKEEGKEGFNFQPVSKKIAIALAGIFSFWIISAIIFSFLFFVGNDVPIGDEENSSDAKVQIAAVFPNSPAEKAGLRMGDTILTLEGKKIEKIEEVQKIVKENLGKEIVFGIKRGKEIFNVKLVPRTTTPKDEGPVGILLVRTVTKKYPFFQAIFEGTKHTLFVTFEILKGYFFAIKNFFKGLPTGVEMVGPVGIFNFGHQISQLGFTYFLNFLAQISIYLAIFNALPIPALDGGRFLLLTIEAVRKKPISKKTEEKITAFSFVILILLAFFVTLKDISKVIQTR